MKAPDKIYIIEYPDGLARFWVKRKKDDVVATILHEYISKDTFLKWAELYKEEAERTSQGHTDNPSYGQAVAMRDLINTLKSL